MFVCFSFYLTLFIFIWNTKRLPQNSFENEKWDCGENNIACTSELKFLGWIKILLQDNNKKQTKKVLR